MYISLIVVIFRHFGALNNKKLETSIYKEKANTIQKPSNGMLLILLYCYGCFSNILVLFNTVYKSQYNIDRKMMAANSIQAELITKIVFAQNRLIVKRK